VKAETRRGDGPASIQRGQGRVESAGSDGEGTASVPKGPALASIRRRAMLNLFFRLPTALRNRFVSEVVRGTLGGRVLMGLYRRIA
jgi:hypothetical protein